MKVLVLILLTAFSFIDHAVADDGFIKGRGEAPRTVGEVGRDLPCRMKISTEGESTRVLMQIKRKTGIFFSRWDSEIDFTVPTSLYTSRLNDAIAKNRNASNDPSCRGSEEQVQFYPWCREVFLQIPYGSSDRRVTLEFQPNGLQLKSVMDSTSGPDLGGAHCSIE